MITSLACINPIRSKVTSINACDGSATIRCPKLPKDTDARIGVRRDPQYQDKKQKIFGYNAILSTSVGVNIKLELPVAATNISGNAQEAKHLIVNKKQIQAHHPCETKIDIADFKYDSIENCQYIRDNDSIPIIDYNPRNENLSKNALLERGYDQNGWPFAPCGLLTRPNGFDDKRQRLVLCCFSFKQCQNLRPKAFDQLKDRYHPDSCPYSHNDTGFTRLMYIKEGPRLVNDIPRGSKRFNTIKKIRSASERSNSIVKENIRILDKPRVLSSERAAILTQIAAIVLLLSRAFTFIVRTTNLIWKANPNGDPSVASKLITAPKTIQNLIQLE